MRIFLLLLLAAPLEADGPDTWIHVSIDEREAVTRIVGPAGVEGVLVPGVSLLRHEVLRDGRIRMDYVASCRSEFRLLPGSGLGLWDIVVEVARPGELRSIALPRGHRAEIAWRGPGAASIAWRGRDRSPFVVRLGPAQAEPEPEPDLLDDAETLFRTGFYRECRRTVLALLESSPEPATGLRALQLLEDAESLLGIPPPAGRPCPAIRLDPIGQSVLDRLERARTAIAEGSPALALRLLDQANELLRWFPRSERRDLLRAEAARLRDLLAPDSL